ncbi:hypothetical protein SCHPADRAFT_931813 [Schizopora paradoxa]|uniref:BTB domain-containing protein n=1 Tax=Schizopora paradoxa TaxID=27342 RepID=A0A0H2RFQ9_9AGAM|nr:hypothetical protein SCHPADRAFT_931813 [Schizopora paradoxa]
MDVDAEPENAQKIPKPHDVLWLHDGNVVLATDSLLFKVHNSVLSMQSSVFKDMFELPTIDGAQASTSGAGMAPELYEGLPLVKLVGDKGEDVAHLLRAVYERQYYSIDDDETPLEIIIALLLLSTKYDFKHIRRDVIAHVSKFYPMSLHEYDEFKEPETMFGEHAIESHFKLLKALHAADVDALLPPAYLACVEYVSDALYERASFLGLECFRNLVKGRFDLTYDLNDLMATVSGDLLDQAGVYKCQKEQKIRIHGLNGHVDVPDFRQVEGSAVVENCLDGLCAECKERVVELINEGRKQIWDKVPSYFVFKDDWDTFQAKLKSIISTKRGV